MDANRFDAIVRELSRRNAVKGAAAVLIGAVAGGRAGRREAQAVTLTEYALLLGACDPAAPVPAIPFPCASLECTPTTTGDYRYRPVLRSAGNVCAAASGPCERDAVCDGTSPNCPPKEIKPAGEVCQAAANACEANRVCSGTSADCPQGAARTCPGHTTCCARQDSLFYGRCVLRLVCAVVRRPKSWLPGERKGRARDVGKGKPRSSARRNQNRRRKSRRGGRRG